MKNPKRKFYVYVDESGQDTKGKFFIVAVLILKNQNLISKKLKQIEVESQKENIKWSKSHPKFRKQYIERLIGLNLFQKSIYFSILYSSKDFLKFTAQTTGQAILCRTENITDYKATVYIDGFNKAELEKTRKELKNLNIKYKKLRGVKKDENNIFIRLVDSICGLIRQAEKGDEWAENILKKLKNNQIIKEV